MSTSELREYSDGPIGSLIRRWWLGLLLLIVGAVVGYLAALSEATQYTSETRLVVGSQSLSSYQVAGFAQASEELASNYARYVDNSSVVSNSLRKALGSQVKAVDSVSASPIPSSDVVSVEVVATSSRAALVGAKAIANELVRLTKSPQDASESELLDSYNSFETKAQKAQSVVSTISGNLSAAKRDNKPTAALQSQLLRAQTKAATLTLQATAAGNKYQAAVSDPPSDSSLSVIQPAAIISDNSKKTREIYAVGGAIVGLLIALVVSTLLERRRVGRRHLRHAGPTVVPSDYDSTRSNFAEQSPLRAFESNQTRGPQ